MRHLAPYLRNRFDYGMAIFFLVAWVGLSLFAGIGAAIVFTSAHSSSWMLLALLTVWSAVNAIAHALRIRDYREERA